MNGILAFPERSMIAEETNGPINDEVLPMIENSAKNKNCPVSTTIALRVLPLCLAGPPQRSLLAKRSDVHSRQTTEALTEIAYHGQTNSP